MHVSSFSCVLHVRPITPPSPATVLRSTSSRSCLQTLVFPSASCPNMLLALRSQHDEYIFFFHFCEIPTFLHYTFQPIIGRYHFYKLYVNRCKFCVTQCFFAEIVNIFENIDKISRLPASVGDVLILYPCPTTDASLFRCRVAAQCCFDSPMSFPDMELFYVRILQIVAKTFYIDKWKIRTQHEALIQGSKSTFFL
jgi:hypothetical protein